MVLEQHGPGSQDEGQKEVEVDGVPGAAQLPATRFTTASTWRETGKRAGRDLEGGLKKVVTGTDRGWRSP